MNQWLPVPFSNGIGDISFTLHTKEIVPLGLETNFNQLEFSIFPNPTFNVLNLKSNVKLKNASIQDISGRLIFTIPFENDLLKVKSIDISTLEDGIYFCTIYGQEGTMTLKFIVKR